MSRAAAELKIIILVVKKLVKMTRRFQRMQLTLCVHSVTELKLSTTTKAEEKLGKSTANINYDQAILKCIPYLLALGLEASKSFRPLRSSR